VRTVVASLLLAFLVFGVALSFADVFSALRRDVSIRRRPGAFWPKWTWTADIEAAARLQEHSQQLEAVERERVSALDDAPPPNVRMYQRNSIQLTQGGSRFPLRLNGEKTETPVEKTDVERQVILGEEKLT